MADTETAVSRSQMFKHVDFVEWATEQGLLNPKMGQAETIAVFAANRNAYRATDRYRALADAGDPQKAARDAERAAAKEAKAKERAEAQAAKAAEREAAKATKAAAKAAKAAPAPAAPAKATKATKATKKAAASSENPFD